MASLYLKNVGNETVILTRTTKVEFGIEDGNATASVTIALETGTLGLTSQEWEDTVPVDEVMGIAQRELHAFATRLVEQTKKWAQT